jgi:hypothetical protein
MIFNNDETAQDNLMFKMDPVLLFQITTTPEKFLIHLSRFEPLPHASKDRLINLPR